MTAIELTGPAYYDPSPWTRLRTAVRNLIWRIFPPKSGLETYTERELARIKVEPGDEMQAEINRDILRVIRTFAREGHSGSSAHYAIDILQKLLRYQPLGPLTGEDSEWNDIGDMSDDPRWQNKRCSHVFKGADGRAYDIDGRVFIEPSGIGFTGQGSRVWVTFPYTPSRVEIAVNEEGEPIEGPSRAELAAQ